MIKRVKDGLVNKKENSVFLAISTKFKLNYLYKNKETQMLLFINRWDGRIGFPGGRVDEGEELLDALYREVYEEINYDIRTLSNIELICSHNIKDKNKDKTCHLYHIEVNNYELKQIMKNSFDAIDFINETNGVFVTHLDTYGEKGLKSFFKNNLVDTVVEETLLLNKKFNKKLTTVLTKDLKVKQNALKLKKEMK